MKAELRADGLHISGYVNVPGRESRPVITRKHGKVNEVIEQRAFDRAIGKTDHISLLLDHDKNKVLASTSDGTLEVYEDEVGLRAEAITSNEEAINYAKQGKLRGWSFNMLHVIDSVEERAGKLPLRHVKDFMTNEISLIVKLLPYYSSTSIELRAEDEEEMELRAEESKLNFNDISPKVEFDNSIYRNRIEKLKSL